MLITLFSDVEIKFENVVASQRSHVHEAGYLAADNEEPRSTFSSPLEIQEVDQIKKRIRGDSLS